MREVFSGRDVRRVLSIDKRLDCRTRRNDSFHHYDTMGMCVLLLVKSKDDTIFVYKTKEVLELLSVTTMSLFLHCI